MKLPSLKKMSYVGALVLSFFVGILLSQFTLTPFLHGKIPQGDWLPVFAVNGADVQMNLTGANVTDQTIETWFRIDAAVPGKQSMTIFERMKVDCTNDTITAYEVRLYGPGLTYHDSKIIQDPKAVLPDNNISVLTVMSLCGKPPQK